MDSPSTNPLAWAEIVSWQMGLNYITVKGLKQSHCKWDQIVSQQKGPNYV